jgi:glyceraldehyde-3-phosphate dehydrogenase/erythrose-4-phosphate dehydrogenase
VQVDRNTTREDVLNAVLQEQTKPTLQDILKMEEDPQLFQKKYQEKLERAAKE